MATTTRDIPTTLNYCSLIGTDPAFLYVSDPPEGKARTNTADDTQAVIVHNARGKVEEHGLSLDTSGFEFVKSESAEKDFTDEEAIVKAYYKEIEELLKKVTGTKRVFVFDHTIRRKPGYKYAEGQPVCGPVERVHIDQTYEASITRVHRHMGEEAESLLKGRVRLINVWRPIGNIVAHKPLAVCDWRSLDTERDLVPTKLIIGEHVGGSFSVKHNPNHRWYYISDQTPEEVTFIKCYDSEVDRARLTPHSAFLDSTSPPEAPQRESIEVRCLLFD